MLKVETVVCVQIIVHLRFGAVLTTVVCEYCCVHCACPGSSKIRENAREIRSHLTFGDQVQLVVSTRSIQHEKFHFGLPTWGPFHQRQLTLTVGFFLRTLTSS